MERTIVDSKAVVSAGFDEAKKTLELEYNNGLVYVFFDVPLSLANRLVEGDRFDEELERLISGKYSCERVNKLFSLGRWGRV